MPVPDSNEYNKGNQNFYQLAYDLYNAITGGGASSVLGTGNNHIGQVGGTTVASSVEFSQASGAVAYLANDIVSDNNVLTFANALRIASGSGYVTGVKIITNKISITPNLRLHLGNSPDTFAVKNDNSPNAQTYALSKFNRYFGYIDLPAMQSQGFSDGSYTVDFTQRIPIIGSTTSLYGIIETLSAFTPNAGQSFTVELLIEQN